jgi:hypothetical protein
VQRIGSYEHNGGRVIANGGRSVLSSPAGPSRIAAARPCKGMIVWIATFEMSVDDETKVMIKAKSGRRVVGHLTAPEWGLLCIDADVSGAHL